MDLDALNEAAAKADGEDGRPTTFVQWKGTEICMDFWCPCGVQSHFDTGFLYALKCPTCGRRYEVATQLCLRQVPTGEPDPWSMQVGELA